MQATCLSKRCQPSIKVHGVTSGVIFTFTVTDNLIQKACSEYVTNELEKNQTNSRLSNDTVSTAEVQYP